MKNRYRNEKVYASYTWTDETSQFDPKGSWSGSDAYWRDYTAYVPRKMLERATASGDHRPLMDWIERNESKGIWV